LHKSWVNPKIELRNSIIQGKGMFASTDIEDGEVIVVWGGNSYTNKEGAMKALEEGRFTMQWDEDVFSVEITEEDETPFLINHSCDPNAWMNDAYTITARRVIQAGEEITADYAMWDGDASYNSSWDCQCKATQCRKKITGKDWQDPHLQKLYQGHFSPLLNKRIENERS